MLQRGTTFVKFSFCYIPMLPMFTKLIFSKYHFRYTSSLVKCHLPHRLALFVFQLYTAILKQSYHQQGWRCSEVLTTWSHLGMEVRLWPWLLHDVKTSEVLSLRAEVVSDNSSYIEKEMGEAHLEFRISRGPEELKEIFRTR